jgi:hypothetical protein
MWEAAKKRAKKFGLEFSIKLEDIVIPEYCPLLGIKLKPHDGMHNPGSPSVDRFRSEGGYTPDNVWVISHRANWIKNNASVEELKCLVSNLSKFTEFKFGQRG